MQYHRDDWLLLIIYIKHNLKFLTSLKILETFFKTQILFADVTIPMAGTDKIFQLCGKHHKLEIKSRRNLTEIWHHQQSVCNNLCYEFWNTGPIRYGNWLFIIDILIYVLYARYTTFCSHIILELLFFLTIILNQQQQGAIHIWRHPFFKIFDPSLLLVTHFTTWTYGVTSTFSRSPSPF